ncbi:MAG: ATP-binding protein, partial [Psychrosphaera sp.]|nr:ATP-binding protein [Psychrosphaera sp.]
YTPANDSLVAHSRAPILIELNTETRMDENYLASLEEALATSADNKALRFTLVNGYHDIQHARAYELLAETGFDSFDKDEQNLLAANVCLTHNDAKQAMGFLNNPAPAFDLTKAKALLALGEMDSAKSHYVKAIKDNPSIEDTELAQKLSLEQAKPDLDKRVKLRVISNDDTDEVEVTRLIQPSERKLTFADVGGLAGVKKQITKKIITPFQKPSLVSRFRKKVGGGILLYGPPGCGKTLLARATAGECNAQFINVVISDILDMYIGESERKLHAIFEQARSQTPAVIFFDEIEALAAKRQHSREATSAKLVSQFLSELDGFAQDNQGVLILGATNVPWALDPAFRRPGRFDRVVFIAPPDSEARAEILKGHLKDRPGGDTINVNKIAKLTSGYSGADLMNLVETGVDEAIEDSINRGEEVPMNQAHIDEALKDTKSTTLEWLTMARNYAKYANDAGQYDDVVEFLRKHGK